MKVKRLGCDCLPIDDIRRISRCKEGHRRPVNVSDRSLLAA